MTQANTISVADINELNREVVDFSEDKEPLMPLKGFTFEGELLTCFFREYDGNPRQGKPPSKGVEFSFRCTKSDVPEMQPGKVYNQIYFTQHPKFFPFMLEKHAIYRKRLLVAVSGQDPKTIKPAVVIQELQEESTGDGLGIPIRMVRKDLGLSSNGKQKVDDSFERL